MRSQSRAYNSSMHYNNFIIYNTDQCIAQNIFIHRYYLNFKIQQFIKCRGVRMFQYVNVQICQNHVFTKHFKLCRRISNEISSLTVYLIGDDSSHQEFIYFWRIGYYVGMFRVFDVKTTASVLYIFTAIFLYN